MYSVTVLTNLYKSRFIPIIQGPQAKYFQDASGILSTLGKCGLKGLIGCILQVDLTVLISFKSLTALLDSRSFQGFDQIQILLLNDCYMFYPREAWVKFKIHTKTFYSILHTNLDLRQPSRPRKESMSHSKRPELIFQNQLVGHVEFTISSNFLTRCIYPT